MNPGTSPFDDPRAGETLVLLSAGGISNCYAVGEDLLPRAISPAQFVAAAECAPDTPSQPLPEGTNERVMAACQAFRTVTSSAAWAGPAGPEIPGQGATFPDNSTSPTERRRET